MLMKLLPCKSKASRGLSPSGSITGPRMISKGASSDEFGDFIKVNVTVFYSNVVKTGGLFAYLRVALIEKLALIGNVLRRSS